MRTALNKDVPQNHNILITNGKSKFIKVYKDGKFRTEYKDDIIADILNNNLGRLEDKANELEDKISDKIMDNHRKFQEVYYKIISFIFSYTKIIYFLVYILFTYIFYN